MELEDIVVQYTTSPGNVHNGNYNVHIEAGLIKVFSTTNKEIFEFELNDDPIIHLDDLIISVSQNDQRVEITAPDAHSANRWFKYIRAEHQLFRQDSSITFESRFVSYYKHIRNFSSRDDVEQTMQTEEVEVDDVEGEDDDDVSGIIRKDFKMVPSTIVPPKMNIVILVVGTRGDVQPFIYFGQALQRDGHRVRLATHVDYRDDVVLKGGLEYYPLAGDPKKLSEYMVKTAGRLLPDILNKEEMRVLPEKMAMLKDITYSCYPACTAVDPEDPEQKPFLADAIIANPVSYGHVHCAEALSIPLHIMFPQPWSPTKEFPHPLSNFGFSSQWSTKNKMSYKMLDEFMWLGLGSMVNNFRKDILNLAPIRSGERGSQLLNDNRVPISHMWSPSFVPRCKDWPPHVDVVGEFHNSAPIKQPTTGVETTNQSANTGVEPINQSPAFVPPLTLSTFLAEGEKPLYIGFGSMVIDDPSRLVDLIKNAADQINCRILLQSGWTKYGEDNELLTDKVMVIGAMPHEWLFTQVSGVVHHGGAGSTSAGLRAGNPTFICPFFGDQHFWAEMVYRAGAGPKGCRIQDLTTDKLIESLSVLREQWTILKAKELGAAMAAEDGIAMGVQSFYRQLPLANMICEVCIFNNKTSRIAQVFCQECNLKMHNEVDEVIHRNGSGRELHTRVPFRPSRIGVVDPSGVISGLGQGLSAVAYELAGGVYDLFASGNVRNLFARPLMGGKVLVHKVVTGATQRHTTTVRGAEIEGALQANNSTITGEHERLVTLTELTTSTTTTTTTTLTTTTITGAAAEEVVTALTAEHQVIEKAYEAAIQLMALWQHMDKDGNRCIDEKELHSHLKVKYLNSKDTVREFFSAMDHDGDHVLTFTEMAWAIAAVDNFQDLFTFFEDKDNKDNTNTEKSNHNSVTGEKVGVATE